MAPPLHAPRIKLPRRTAILLAIAIVAACAPVLVRAGGRWTLQSRAAKGPHGTPASMTVTTKRIERVAPEFAYAVGLLNIGLPEIPSGMRMDPPYTRFELRPRGTVIVLDPRHDPAGDAHRSISILIETARAAPLNPWTLFWMPAAEFETHIARLVSVAAIRAGFAAVEIVEGDDVRAVIGRFQADEQRAGAAILWYDKEAIAANIHVLDVDDPQAILRDIVARTRPSAK